MLRNRMSIHTYFTIYRNTAVCAMVRIGVDNGSELPTLLDNLPPPPIITLVTPTFSYRERVRILS